MNKGKTLVLLVLLVAASLASAQENDLSSVMTDKVFTVGGVTFCMKPVQGGTFTMGATAEQGKTIWHDEYPTHEVTVSSFDLWVILQAETLFKCRLIKGFERFKMLERKIGFQKWSMGHFAGRKAVVS